MAAEKPLRNFSFLPGGFLAGMAHPGTGEKLRKSLQYLREQGVSALVSLTGAPLPRELVAEHRLGYLQLAVADFAAPGMPQVEELVRFVEETRQQGGRVAIHCSSGLGRTGTMLACYLVSQGKSAAEAIQLLRQLRPGSLETRAQEFCVHRYALRRRRQQG